MHCFSIDALLDFGSHGACFLSYHVVFCYRKLTQMEPQQYQHIQVYLYYSILVCLQTYSSYVSQYQQLNNNEDVKNSTVL